MFFAKSTAPPITSPIAFTTFCAPFLMPLTRPLIIWPPISTTLSGMDRSPLTRFEPKSDAALAAFAAMSDTQDAAFETKSEKKPPILAGSSENHWTIELMALGTSIVKKLQTAPNASSANVFTASQISMILLRNSSFVVHR